MAEMPHSRWQVMPDLTPDEFTTLKADISERGIIVPIVIDAESGEIIDGHHRLKAHEELRAEGVKVQPYPREVRTFADDEERMAVALSVNLARRHLSRKQRTELVAKLRGLGYSLRKIGEVLSVDDKTVRNDLAEIAEHSAIELPERTKRKGGGSYPARRPSIVVTSDRDQHRAENALRLLGEDAPTKMLTLSRSEELAREARMNQLRATKVPERIEGPTYELRLGDIREIWAGVPDGSIDAIVTDPPYDKAGIPIFEDFARLAARVLKPGRLAAIYCGHLSLPDEMALLETGGLSYVWHGVNVLNGAGAQIRTRKVNGHHRSVLLYSSGTFQPRKWFRDLFISDGKGGPETRPLHKWQQAVDPVAHWVRSVSEPGETVLDPFLGSGTTAIAAVSERRRFLGGDLDPACVAITRQRLEELADYGGPDDAA